MSLFYAIKNLQDSDKLYKISDEELKTLQRMLTKIISDIATVCKKHHIDWMMTYGSLLGTVRHHGFIPWDDDLDIFMTRAEFEKFKKIFHQELGQKYELKIPGDKNYLYHFPRIYQKNTLVRSIQSTKDSPCGLSVDIFLLENISNSKLARIPHGLLSLFYTFASSVARTNACRENLLKYGSDSDELVKNVKFRVLLSLPFRYRSVESWMKVTDACYAKCKDNQSEYVVIPVGRKRFFKEIYKRSHFTTIPMQFENIEVLVPKDYQYFLTLIYGSNYMQLPPKEKREKHSFAEFQLREEA